MVLNFSFAPYDTASPDDLPPATDSIAADSMAADGFESKVSWQSESLDDQKTKNLNIHVTNADQVQRIVEEISK